MADSPDFPSFSDSYPDIRGDNTLCELFPGIDFSNTDADPSFEARLESDFPVPKAPAAVSGERDQVSATPQLNAIPAAISEQPENEVNVLPQFLDPRQTCNGTSLLPPPPQVLPTSALPAPTLLDPTLFNPALHQPAYHPSTYAPLPQQPVYNGFPNVSYPTNLGIQWTPINARPTVYQAHPNLPPSTYATQFSSQPLAQPYLPGGSYPGVHQYVHPQPMPTSMIHNPQIVYLQHPTNPGYQIPWEVRPVSNPQPVHQIPPREPPRRRQRAPPLMDNGKRGNSYIPLGKDKGIHDKEPPSPGIVTTSSPLKRPATDEHGNALLDGKIPRRAHVKPEDKDVQIEPERYYGPSPPKPADWGPVNAFGSHLFRYTNKGELAAGAFYTVQQMRQYLMGPGPNDDFDPPIRLPGVQESWRKTRQGLTLWIGWPAPMSNARYPRAGESTKCRFKDCLFRRTIAVGEPWVILDERQNVNGELVDPFHNAGYVHLFCLEHYFDIVELWHVIDIRPDHRYFKREEHQYFCLGNRMPGIDFVLRHWWRGAYADWSYARSQNMKRRRTHATSLARCLVKFKLEHECRSHAESRRRRGGADLSRHRGDPALKRKLVAYRKNGLLTETGSPVMNADEKLAEIEHQAKRARLKSRSLSLQPHHPDTFDPNSSHSHPYSHQLPGPVQNYGESYDSYIQQAGMDPSVNGVSVYPQEPIYISDTPSPLLVCSPLAAHMTGRKRSRDEIPIGDVDIPQGLDRAAVSGSPMLSNQVPTSPKRQRMGGEVAQDIPYVTATAEKYTASSMQHQLTPINPTSSAGNADPQIIPTMQDGAHVAASIWTPGEAETLDAVLGVGSSSFLDEKALNEFFGTPENSNGKSVGSGDDDTDGKIGREPEEGELPCEAVASSPDTGKNNEDDLDSLFGDPEDCC